MKVLVLLILGVYGCTQQPTVQTPVEKIELDTIVYTNIKSKIYHRISCEKIKSNWQSLTINDARSIDYKPCYYCYNGSFVETETITRTTQKKKNKSSNRVTDEPLSCMPINNSIKVISLDTVNKINHSYVAPKFVEVEKVITPKETKPKPNHGSYNSSSSYRTIHTGPRGGRYYINKNGNKTYIKK